MKRRSKMFVEDSDGRESMPTMTKCHLKENSGLQSCCLFRSYDEYSHTGLIALSFNATKCFAPALYISRS